jgi:hypothetical protein
MHKAQSTEYVHKALKELILEGGEGIVARGPNSLYVHGRAASVMKFKVSSTHLLKTRHLLNTYVSQAHKDQEALIVDIEQDPSGHIHYLIKLYCPLSHFSHLSNMTASTNDVTIKAQYNTTQGSMVEDLQPGDIVTFCYNIVNSQGTPSNATILRVRKDLTWDSVLSSNIREAELNSKFFYIIFLFFIFCFLPPHPLLLFFLSSIDTP